MRSKILVHKGFLRSFPAVLFAAAVGGSSYAGGISYAAPADPSYSAFAADHSPAGSSAADEDAASEARAESMADAVERYLHAKNYAAATASALELTTRYPRYVAGWMLLGYCRSLTSDFTGSNEAYDRALGLGVKPDLVYSRKAYNHVRLGDLEEARRCYRSILDVKPNDAETLAQLAYVEGKLENLDAAAECYRRALDISPDDVDFLVALASVEAKRGDDAAVAGLLEKANLLDPDNTEVLGRLGVIYMKEKNEKAAIEVLERLVSLDPRDANARRNLGAVYYRMGEKEKALPAFEKAMALGGDNDDLYGPLADCYVAVERTDEALRVIKEGIEDGIQEAWLYSLWGKILEDAKDYDGAIAKFSLAVRAGEAPWSDYAQKQIARQSELRNRERIMEGRMQP